MGCAETSGSPLRFCQNQLFLHPQIQLVDGWYQDT